MTFWDWEYTGPLPTPDTRYSGPGVAEALILAGQVRGGTVHRDLEWVVQGSSEKNRGPLSIHP